LDIVAGHDHLNGHVVVIDTRGFRVDAPCTGIAQTKNMSANENIMQATEQYRNISGKIRLSLESELVRLKTWDFRGNDADFPSECS